jgi:hypothetical protein
VYRIYQEQRAAGKQVRLMILKARQLGISTQVLALQLARAVLYPNSVSFTLSKDKEQSATNLLDQIRYHHSHLPDWLRPMIRLDNRSHIDFSNPEPKTRAINPGLQSKMYIDSGDNPNAGRSFTASFAHFSEFAMYNNPERSLTSMMNAMSGVKDSVAIIESTAQGAAGLFYEMWQDATNGKSEEGWMPIFIPFWVNPEYCHHNLSQKQEEHILSSLNEYEKEWVIQYRLNPGQISWVRERIAIDCHGSVGKFLEEYAPNAEECFLVQGDSVFPKDRVRNYASKIKYDYPPGQRGRLARSNGRVGFAKDDKGPLIIWEFPVASRTYAMGADPCSGIRGEIEKLSNEEKRKLGRGGDLDYSAIEVIHIAGKNSYVQVAEYCSGADYEELAEQCILLGEFYNRAILMPESNGVGHALVKSLRHRYPNLGHYERADKRKVEISKYLGWDSSPKSMALLKQKLISVINNEQILIHSEALVREMTTFIYRKDGKMEHAPGTHDDRLISLGLALQAAEQALIGKLPVHVPEDDPYIWTPSGYIPFKIAPSFDERKSEREAQAKSDLWMTL